jgi:hypothetical protein
MRGFLSNFSAGWGLRHSYFETRWLNAIEPPGPRQQQHNNQTMDERVGAQVARGDCMGGHLDLPVLPCCYYAKKKGCLGLVAVVSNQRFRLKREYNTRYNRTCRQLGNDTTYDTEKKSPTSHDVADTLAVSGRRVRKTQRHVVKTNC